METALRAELETAVDDGFAAQTETTRRLVAIPSLRGAEGPAQDLMADLLRARGYVVDDWTVGADALSHHPGWAPLETSSGLIRTVVGTRRNRAQRGRRRRRAPVPEGAPAGDRLERLPRRGLHLPDAAAETVLQCAGRAVYGFSSVPERVMTGLTDTRFYGLYHGIPAFCFGPTGTAIHGFDERVELDSVRKLTLFLALFVAEWCGVGTP